MNNYLIVIPARYKSKRFPGKPLIDIFGKTMIERVYEKCRGATSEKNIIIATDSDKIIKHCISKKMNYIQTSSKCLTGTDRVAEVAKKIKKTFYINVQGDEPLIKSSDIKRIIKCALKEPNKIFNAMCSIKNKEDFYNLNIPKVVTSNESNLIYISRAAIPSSKKKNFVPSKKQVCIYSFPRNALKDFTKNKKTKNEIIEDIEILRFLDLGYIVRMLNVSNSSIAIDTPLDLIKVKKILKNETN
jgi:3-deoxy-manno-octulosonate cytidylyltransferase (CMP-KDO synthetase)